MPRVLVADDDRLIREMLKDLLVEEGHEVVECSDGASALEAIAQESPDLVFLDLVMPGMAGEYVAAAIKGDDRTQFIPVVVLTSECDERTRSQLLDTGVDEFLVKPFSVAQLRAKVRSLLRTKELHDRLLASFKGVELLEHVNMELIQELNDSRSGDEEFLLRAIGHWGAGGGGMGAPTHLWVCADSPGDLDAFAIHRAQEGPPIRRTVRLRRGTFLDILEPYRQTGRTYWCEGVSWPVLEVLWPEPPFRPNLAGILEGDLWVLASGFPRSVSIYDSRWLASLARQYRNVRTFVEQVRNTEEAFQYTMEALARAAEVHDDATGSHLQRVNAFSGLLAQAVGCDRTFVKAVGRTAMMHDVGKIHIHSKIIAKEGLLDPKEMEIMKRHPLFGARILGDSPRLLTARDIALCHHERWDGTGYPRGLRGEEIPMAARIVTLSDVYDALRSPRPYKPALSHEKAVRIIRYGDSRGPAGAFDPRCLETFLDVASHIDGLFLRFQEGASTRPE